MTAELEEVRRRLAEMVDGGELDGEAEGALWTVDRALKGGMGLAAALEYGRSVLARRGDGGAAPVEVRLISREEYEAMRGEGAQQEARGVDREEYERMMREAQDG